MCDAFFRTAKVSGRGFSLGSYMKPEDSVRALKL